LLPGFWALEEYAGDAFASECDNRRIQKNFYNGTDIDDCKSMQNPEMRTIFEMLHELQSGPRRIVFKMNFFTR